jgi:methylmalonyl-CoA/ethylmalonyl-CoA epimerase
VAGRAAGRGKKAAGKQRESERKMDVIGVEHVGIAVSDLDACARRFEEVLGIERVGGERLEGSKIEVAVFQVGNTKIELIAPTSPDSPISKFLSERGNGIHHICLKVGDIKGCLDELAGKEVGLIDKVPRSGAFGHKIAFLSPKSLCNILVELNE